MDDDDSWEDTWEKLSWFSYGYLCAEDDKKAKSDSGSEEAGGEMLVAFFRENKKARRTGRQSYNDFGI